ncbi:TCP-1/cpn60 chaperonin family protein [Methanimicrococcus blatticola]|uniref:Chaperonin GroEL (HSP60 family) n=1 Tax=Methanimicrococcus blatticola TaxID=91560 RepID=A0A484F2C1_9EURY|nr:TCP-1/cpn60 chaperonin family protein [Methanimicrococcus blatticola]MBZ3936393.1 TCP-1/cpn60 chaperonin family protein [Methanimicrococcus blatticola]MCC2509555.1 TCP-1/cpn60 chaperonin family protein [Methanimicrococcus blatticola]TDQ67607.1 chaperonin GroEL (HSP60 family) [Methanimicrococcus blatticola]
MSAITRPMSGRNQMPEVTDELVRQIRERVAVDGPVEDDQLLFHIETMVTDIREMLASSFGPCGMNKLVYGPAGDVYMTSDGKTIIKEIDVLHPVAVSLKRLGQSMDKSCGDGTKTALLLACSLLKNALPLLRKNVHPAVIARGYEMAMGKAYEMMEYVAEDADDAMMLSAVKSAAFGKGILEDQADRLAEAMLQTVRELDRQTGGSFLDLEKNVKVLKKVGSPDVLSFSGVILDETPARDDMPKHLQNPAILLLRNDIKPESGYVNPQHFVRIDKPETAFEFKDARKAAAYVYAEKIIESGANLIFCEGEVDFHIEEALARKKILVYKRLKMKDMEYVSAATGADFMKIHDSVEDMNRSLGYADEIKVIKKRYETFAYLKVDYQPVTTVLIHEPMKYGLGKIEEAADDALNNAALLIKNPYVVTGAGGTEYFLSRSLRIYANTLTGKEQLAVNAFADAVESLAKTLASNIGMDVTDAMIDLSAQQEDGIDARLDVCRHVVGNSPAVYDCATVKKYALVAATETAMNILRVDEILLKR